MTVRSRHDDTNIVAVRQRARRDYALHDLADPRLIIVYDEDAADSLLRMTFDRLHGVWWIHQFAGPVRGWPALLGEGSRELIRRGHGGTPALWKDVNRPTVSKWLRQQRVPVTGFSFGDVLDGSGVRFEYISITANDLLAKVTA